jgi:hypothetical protein
MVLTQSQNRGMRIKLNQDADAIAKSWTQASLTIYFEGKGINSL